MLADIKSMLIFDKQKRNENRNYEKRSTIQRNDE